MSYYYSNFNRNNKPNWRNVWASIKKYPAYLWHKIKSEKTLRRKILRSVMYLAAGFLLLGSLVFASVALTLPNPSKLNDRIIPQSTKIYARDGTTLLYEIHGEAKRTLINLTDLHPYTTEATVAIEDKNFYKNPGVDWRGILRSIWVDITTVSASQGGSTITQQFVRNAILTRDKTFIRKIKEIVLAIEIGQIYTKDQILQLYLNEIPYGRNAYGVEAAAESYFGKHAKDLDIAESAYLAALPQAPSYYSANREALDARKNTVLDQMLDQGYITKQQHDDAVAEKVNITGVKDAILAPHFVMYVQSILAQQYGEQTLEEGGLNVVTTLDWNMQQIAEKAVTDGVAKNEKANKASNAGLVAIDPKTGQILAMVGSKDYFAPNCDYCQVNVALSQLQPGSSIKPYIYATAFKQGMSPATMLMDVKTDFGTYGGADYIPTNYDGTDHGIVNMRKAMAGSLNVPAVKTLDLVGVQNAIDTAKDMGITSDISADKCGLSLVLGGCEVTLLDHTSAMGVFANMGVKQDHTPILKITDSNGKTLQEYKQGPGTQALDPQIAYQIDNIMTDNDARSFIFGANSKLILPDRIVAAKTGTTNEWRDGWTLGFTPSLVAGVWTGNNDHSKMRAGADGVVVAAPIWNQFMEQALKGTPAEQFTEPPGIQHILVDSVSGKLPTEYTPSTKSEVFGSMNLPTQYDDVHVPVKINKVNGKLASAQTPPEDLVTQVYTVLHSEMPNNPNWENPVEAWAIGNGYTYPPTQQDDGSTSPSQNFNVDFIAPTNNQNVSTKSFDVQVEVSGTVPMSVDLFLNGNLVGSKSQVPYNFTIQKASKGTGTLIAIAHLLGGGTVEKTISVNIQ
jgi:1A family penicillin-binding protein